MQHFTLPPMALATPISFASTQPITFEYAAASYVEHGGDNRYLPRIVDYFNGRALATIFPFDIYQMAEKLYPTVANATRNRQALTPARSVLIHGYERGWCNRILLRRFKEEPKKRKIPAAPVWLHAFARQADNDDLSHVAAIVLFMAHTGARVSEAVALQWPQVDLANRTALLLKTKTSTNSSRALTDELVLRLHELRSENHWSPRVFRYRCRHSVNERIRDICKRAGISYKSSHACGRHSFATNSIDNGIDVKTAMQAGGWRSVEIFLGTYVTPKANAGRIVADRFNAYQYDADL